MKFIHEQTEQKLRGGYYTPKFLADYLLKWGTLNKSHISILEPSFGDGSFIESLRILPVSKQVTFTGFEINETEYEKAKLKAEEFPGTNFHLNQADFLKWALSNIDKQIFDLVVGNPPFVRYQFLKGELQAYSEMIFKLMNVAFSKHMNLWSPFVLASISMLKPNGKIAMVLPAELLHVTHSRGLRGFIESTCEKILIIDPEELWFDKTLQGTILLLANKKRDLNDKSKGIHIHRVKGKEFVNKNPQKIFKSATFVNGKNTSSKWIKGLLDEKELKLLNEIMDLNEVKNFKDIASVDVGVVTGANDFFLVDLETVLKYKLENYAHPMFGRSSHCPGVVFDEKQHLLNVKNGLPCYFIWFNVDDYDQLSVLAKEYIKLGEQKLLHTRYKCRIRTPWFNVPSVYSTELGLLKRAHDIPRLIYNKMGAYTTDTAYRIKSKTNLSPEHLSFSFVNSLTALSAELEGRHYGGGVLELVPSEIENLLIPIPSDIKADLCDLHLRFLKGEKTINILDNQDNIILKAIGLSNSDINIIQNAAMKLRDRRQRN